MTLGETFQLGPKAVHRMGFGAMQLPGPGVIGPPRDHDEAIAVLRRAVELGVDHIDTAQFYGPNVAVDLILTSDSVEKAVAETKARLGEVE